MPSPSPLSDLFLSAGVSAGAPANEDDIFTVVVEACETYLGVEFEGPAPLPDEPTAAPPGSPWKLAVFADRVARRISLHHADDADMTTSAPFVATRNGRLTPTGERQPKAPPSRQYRLTVPRKGNSRRKRLA